MLYTDGSPLDGIRDGGSAFVVTCGDPDNIDVVHSARQRGHPFTTPKKRSVKL